MYLLINKLMPSTRNPYDGLDCSQHGSLAPELLNFMVNKKLPKASLSTFGMQPAHMPALKEYLIRCSNEATGHDRSRDAATSYELIDWHHHGEVFKKLSNG
jgi:hypothetical protein